MTTTLAQWTIAAHASPTHRPPAHPSEAVFEAWADEQGLSPMQREVLGSDAWVRVVDAPTGSGKSYAFQRAVWPIPELGPPGRVLFIAPTRRLTEALSSDLKMGLMREVTQRCAPDVAAGRLSAAQVEAQARRVAQWGVLTWNGAQAFEPGQSASAVRLGELGRPLPDLPGQPPLPVAQTVFTVMEVVEQLLFPRRARAGAAEAHTQHVLGQFRHVVFDEFHTLGEGGTALALVTLNLIRVYNQTRPDFLPPIQVTFLSATPVDLLSFLALSLDTPLPRLPPGRLPPRGEPHLKGDGICLIEEVVVSPQAHLPLRVLHGDVQVAMVRCGSMLALLEHEEANLVHQLRQRAQVVVIFDAKFQLMHEAEAITQWMDALCLRHHLPKPSVLRVNSSDDKTKWGLDGEESIDEQALSQLTLESADVLLATASVEAGVTFRDNRLLVMEPGFSALNLVQRLGRCARGNKAGRVVVRVDDEEALAHDYRPWWQQLVPALVAAYGASQSSVSIGDFLRLVREKSLVGFPTDAKVATQVNAWFGPVTPSGSHAPEAAAQAQDDLSETMGLVAFPKGGFYAVDHLGERARLRACLYWAVQYHHLHRFLPKGQADGLMGNPPKRVKAMLAMLGVLQRSFGPRQKGKPRPPAWPPVLGLGAFAPWLNAWIGKSCELRDIGPQVMVVDRHAGKDRCRPFDREWLLQHTNAFAYARPASPELMARFFKVSRLAHLEVMDARSEPLRVYSKAERKALHRGRRMVRGMTPQGAAPIEAESVAGVSMSTAHALRRLADQVRQCRQPDGKAAGRAIQWLAFVCQKTGGYAPLPMDWDAEGALSLEEDLVL